MMNDREEGLLSDRLKQDEIDRKAQDLTWRASDMIHDVLKDGKIKKFSDRKKKISSILDDLERVIAKIGPSIKPEKGGENEKDSLASLTVTMPD